MRLQEQFSDRASKLPMTILDTTDKTARLSDQIMRLMGVYGHKKTYLGWRVVDQWEEIVGERIAKVATAERYQDKVLYVKALNPTWRQNLSMEHDLIVSQIRKFTGLRVIERIHFN